MSRREDVRHLYLSGASLHEVPFTMREGEGWVRGTIDCLVRDDTGTVTVLEFKTGRPRAQHQAQLQLYRRAAEQIFRTDRVDARLVYPYADEGGSPTSNAGPIW
jgi:ATP-dependent exoDNAse (exonuclease V) beta subunit